MSENQHATAKSKGEDDFVADTYFEIRRGATHWGISAGDLEDMPEKNRAFFFNVPLSLSDTGEEQIFLIGANDGAEDAWAHYLSKDIIAPSRTGHLKIKYFGDQKRMTGFFEFEAEAFRHVFHLTEGVFDMTESIESRTGNLVSAEITGSISATLSTSQIEVANRPDAQIGLSASQIIWQPGSPCLHTLTLIIPEETKAGTYQIGKVGDPFHAVYHVVDPNGGFFQSIEGTIELLVDASADHLEATLSFTAIAHGDPVKTVQVKNGTIIFQRPPAK